MKLRKKLIEVALPLPEINDAGRVAPQVALPERRIVIPTLQRIERFVHLILSEFALKFP